MILESFQWGTRKAAEDECRAILRDPQYGTHARITDPRHDAILRELVEVHHDAVEKIGVGIDFFYIGLTRDGNRPYAKADATGIWIQRVDGSQTDFSYRTAIKQYGPKQNVKDAMRVAAEERRLAYRDQRFAQGPVVSDLTGDPIAFKAQGVVIYIEPTFEQLSYRFAESLGGWDAISVHSGHGAARIGAEFTDPAVKTAWLEFLEQHAVLAIATQSEQARRPRRSETAWTP